MIDTVLIKVASRCNINCSYCYVYNMGDDGWRQMPPLISDDTVDATCRALDQLRRFNPSGFATVLHGGEPLMLGHRRLEELLSKLRKALPGQQYPIAIQTNGMLLTPEILSICDGYDAALSVSIDGPKSLNDRFRIGKRGEGTHDAVVEGIKLLRGHPSSQKLFSGVLAVVNPLSNPATVYRYLKALGAPSIDFLYRDGNHTSLPFGKSALESVEYGSWLVEILDLYLRDQTPPRVRILDDLMKLCLGGRGQKEGSGQATYGIAIIDTDGTISKNDTLKSTYDGADRFKASWSVHTSSLTDFIGSDEYREYVAAQRPSCAECQGCSDVSVCGGGMPLHRWRRDNGFDNPSVYCSDQRHLISEIRDRLRRAGVSS